MAVTSAGRLSECRCGRVTLYSIVARALRPSRETACEVKGSTTAATCGACFARPSVASTAARYLASVMLVPAGAWNTICALVPAAGGSVLCRWSRAFCEDEPGIVKSL